MKDYKKILEGVVNIISATEKSDIGFANICSYIGENCPELKESEDERIRKELIEFVKSRGGFKQEYIAWLEKQAEVTSDKDDIEVEEKGIREAFNKIEDEKQCKQKPQRIVSAEAKQSLLHDKYEGLTDFEKTLANICIGWIGEETGWKQYIKDNADVLLRIAVEKFNSVQDVPFEQKPAWTKEDERKIQDCIDAVSHVNLFKVYYQNELVEWLKSLKQRIGG